MHYYKRNLGDYAKKAGRLTMLQHGAYNLLIDACYDREEFPTLEQAIEWTWSITDEEIEAVKFVLNRFFKLDKEGQYIQDRILQELLEYHQKADKNKQIAVEREAKRKQNSTNRSQTVNETSPNHKPLTNNHKPLTINHNKTIAQTSLLDDGFNEFWNFYPKKVGKDKAKTEWNKKNPKIDDVLKALEWQKESEQWDKGFIPNPATYLSQGRWQDEPINKGAPF
jgi:uncharacterized protein YdaU (DUF1376 family)